MTKDQLLTRIETAGFPLVIRTRDGREYSIDRRDALTIAMGAIHLARDGFSVVLSIAELAEVKGAPSSR